MTHSIILIAALCMLPTSKFDMLTFDMQDTTSVFNIPVSSHLNTVIKFPINCHKAISANTDIVTAAVDKKDNSLIQITAQIKTHLQQFTNVTVSCTDDVVVSFKCTVSEANIVPQVVKMNIAGKQQHTIRSILDKAQEEIRHKTDKEVRDNFFRGFLTTFLVNQDTEEKSNNLVFVRVYQQLRAGNQGIVFFTIKNKSNNNFQLEDIEIQLNNLIFTNSQVYITNTTVLKNAIENGILVFDYDTHESKNFKLIVRGTNRTFHINGIDFQ